MLLSIKTAAGSSVKIIYSPEEVLDISRGNPGKETVFLAVGFETTAPAIAYIVREPLKKSSRTSRS
jgi:hydrogenase expression/formation protein HypD